MDKKLVDIRNGGPDLIDDELTEPTLQLSAAYLGADVSHGSMPVSMPNTSARREAEVSFQEPSDRSTE